MDLSECRSGFSPQELRERAHNNVKTYEKHIFISITSELHLSPTLLSLLILRYQPQVQTQAFIGTKDKSFVPISGENNRRTDGPILNPSAGVCGATGTRWTGINPQFHGLSTE